MRLERGGGSGIYYDTSTPSYRPARVRLAVAVRFESRCLLLLTFKNITREKLINREQSSENGLQSTSRRYDFPENMDHTYRANIQPPLTVCSRSRKSKCKPMISKQWVLQYVIAIVNWINRLYRNKKRITRTKFYISQVKFIFYYYLLSHIIESLLKILLLHLSPPTSYQ